MIDYVATFLAGMCYGAAVIVFIVWMVIKED